MNDPNRVNTVSRSFKLRAMIKRSLGSGIGLLIGSVIRYRRKEALEILSRCFPEKQEQERVAIVDGMYRNFGLNIVEWIAMACLKDVAGFGRENVEIENIDGLRELVARNRGVIILIAHIGNFMLLAIPARLIDAPMYIITKKIRPEWVHNKWESVFAKFGTKMLARRNSYMDCRAALKNKGVLGFILDQNMKRKRGVFVDFFGRPACTSPGLAFLSADCQAPVVPVMTIRQPDGTHKVVFMQPVDPPPDRKPETILKATQHYTSIIEKMVREHPDQWIWIHRRWRTRPEEETSASTPEPVSSAPEHPG